MLPDLFFDTNHEIKKKKTIMSPRKYKCNVVSCPTDRERGFSDFPKNELRKIWAEKLNLTDSGKKVRICHEHFSNNDFEHSREDGRLKKNVVPSLNLPMVSLNFRAKIFFYMKKCFI